MSIHKCICCVCMYFMTAPRCEDTAGVELRYINHYYLMMMILMMMMMMIVS